MSATQPLTTRDIRRPFLEYQMARGHAVLQ